MQLELDSEHFTQVPSESIDCAVMEKTQRMAVVPCDIGWSDVGSWESLSNLSVADANGNRLEGEVIAEDATNCFVRSKHRIAGILGVNDLFIVDTPDALLVSSKSHAQQVKNLYKRLKENNHEAHSLHQTVNRPWGTYTVLEEGPGFKVKRIEVKPGASLSLQSHQHRSEHWVVVEGKAEVVNDDQILQLNKNESTYIQAGHKHRLINRGTESLQLIEVQTGSYLGEDDIQRFEDIYRRA